MFQKNDVAGSFPGGGATMVAKPTAILAENAGATTPNTLEKNPVPGREPSVIENHGYTLGRTICSGSYATVKVARSERHQRDVAVKIVSKFQAPTEYLKKFLPRQIEVVKGLKHQNLIKFLQFAENGSLLDIIRRDNYIDEVRARRWFQQIVDGVGYCHERGVVHRDIKCENLLMDIEYNIKLADFGFARGHMKPINGVSPLSETFCGSYAYASPEILLGVPYQPQLSDIWSMGVVLYAIVFGRLPFDDTYYKQLLKQVQAKVTFPKEPKVSSACRSFITRILAPARSRLNISAIRNDLWLTMTSDVTRSQSSEDSLDSVTTSSRNDSLEQSSSVIRPLLTKEMFRAAARKPRRDGGNTTDEEQPIRSVKPLNRSSFKY
uniref:Protein kinase domain-containing protein n=1 Tax=Timema shepardi TaxID=629360 RepID=A0A7R9B489_TIMSH|nr:unnamed protein product [Timema shepardi]